MRLQAAEQRDAADEVRAVPELVARPSQLISVLDGRSAAEAGCAPATAEAERCQG
jgi:hypothetical protein